MLDVNISDFEHFNSIFLNFYSISSLIKINLSTFSYRFTLMRVFSPICLLCDKYHEEQCVLLAKRLGNFLSSVHLIDISRNRKVNATFFFFYISSPQTSPTLRSKNCLKCVLINYLAIRKFHENFSFTNIKLSTLIRVSLKML